MNGKITHTSYCAVAFHPRLSLSVETWVYSDCNVVCMVSPVVNCVLQSHERVVEIPAAVVCCPTNYCAICECPAFLLFEETLMWVPRSE